TIKNWTAEDLKPYQSYLVNGVALDTLFNGFIFNPIMRRKGHYLYQKYADFGTLPQKKDCKIVLNRLFKMNHNFEAVANNTVAGKQTDIWVTLPYPILTQENFGSIDGKELNFKNDDDRFSAVQWWISKFLSKWAESIHLHNKLLFRGFVWPRASIAVQDENIV